MKRLLALVLLAGSLFVAAPAPSANAAVCEFALPQVPDDCVSEAVYNYVTGLQAHDATASQTVGLLQADNTNLRATLWQSGVDLQAARAATDAVTEQRDAAYDEIDRLRVKVKALKKRIKKLQHQLPRVVI